MFSKLCLSMFVFFTVDYMVSTFLQQETKQFLGAWGQKIWVIITLNMYLLKRSVRFFLKIVSKPKKSKPYMSPVHKT